MIAFKNEKRMWFFQLASMASHSILYSIKDRVGYRVSRGSSIADHVFREIILIIIAKIRL